MQVHTQQVTPNLLHINYLNNFPKLITCIIKKVNHQTFSCPITTKSLDVKINKCRGESVECDDEKDSGRYHHHLVGEEDAIWLLRLVLPYVNEVLLNLRSLFSGEPATTMKVKQKSSCCFGATVPWTHASLSRFVPTDRVMHVICSWHCCCLQWPGVATLSPSGRWPNWVSTTHSSPSMYILVYLLFLHFTKQLKKDIKLVK